MLRTHFLFAVLSLVALLAGRPALAVGAGCSNTMASLVPVDITTSGGSERCGLGLVIFGFGGGIIGSKCGQFDTRTPAHQTCLGAASKGNTCALEKVEMVQTRECHCGGLVILGLQIGIPTTCVCGSWQNNDAVEDFQTDPCPSLHN